MATITSRPIIRALLQSRGIYPGDPQAYQIWSYIADSDEQRCAVYWRAEDVDILSIPSCRYPTLLWDQRIPGDGLTPAGLDWLAANASWSTEVPSRLDIAATYDKWLVLWQAEHPGQVAPTPEQFSHLCEMFAFEPDELGLQISDCDQSATEPGLAPPMEVL